jgi:nucleoid DNA-binding protein
MSGMLDIAKKAKLSPMQCGHCGSSNDAQASLEDFFDLILRKVAAGGVVHIKGFGVFRARPHKGRTLHTPVMEGGQITFGDRMVLRFHQSIVAKAKLAKYSEKHQKIAKPDDGENE